MRPIFDEAHSTVIDCLIKLGHPQWASNLVSEVNRCVPQTMQSYRPSSNTFQYSPVKGRSVPAFCVTSYCTGVSSDFSTSAEGFTKDCSLISTPFQVDKCASDGFTIKMPVRTSSSSSRPMSCPMVSSPAGFRSDAMRCHTLPAFDGSLDRVDSVQVDAAQDEWKHRGWQAVSSRETTGRNGTPYAVWARTFASGTPPTQSMAPTHCIPCKGLPASASIDRSMISLAPRSVRNDDSSGLPVDATTSVSQLRHHADSG